MELCSEKHDEVCFDGRLCPACDSVNGLLGEIADLEKELRETKTEVERLEVIIDEH